MKHARLIGVAVVSVGCWAAALSAQGQQIPAAPQEEEEGGGGPRVPIPKEMTSANVQPERAKTVKTEVAVTQAVRSDTPVFRGEGHFQQKCGVCHLGRWRKSGQLKPVLDLAGVLKGASADREKALREQVMHGSPNMPGFQNAFTPREFDDLIAYLKTL